jgi:hypothetical protein
VDKAVQPAIFDDFAAVELHVGFVDNSLIV